MIKQHGKQLVAANHQGQVLFFALTPEKQKASPDPEGSRWPVFTSTVTAIPEPSGTVLLPALMLCCFSRTFSGNDK
jgi:hypothetical protein